LDIAGVMADEKEQFDNHDYPKEVRLAAQFSVDF
jgi:hypothetical protein